MKFRALNFCIMLILLNVSILILTSANVLLPSEVPSPKMPTEGGASQSVDENKGYIEDIIDKLTNYVGFVNDDGSINLVHVGVAFGAVVAILSVTTLSFVSTSGLLVVLFSIIFWGSTVITMGTMDEMFKSFGWGYMFAPMYLVIGIFFIIGAMELSGGGFGAHE